MNSSALRTIHLVICAAVFVSSSAQASVLGWTFYGPGSTFKVRTIAEGGSCPKLTVDDQMLPMQVRPSSQSAEFPLVVCEAQAPRGAQKIQVDGVSLPVPSPNPKRIVVLGDTGCVIKSELKSESAKPKLKVQDCNNAERWPFAQVAQAASRWKPDLVIHVGDYHYREAPCPLGELKCVGAISGDQWTSWKQDFFTPASPLLQSAPWVFTRGNHELCGRGGEGWSRLLDPQRVSASCSDVSDPYRVQLGGLNLVVIDSGEIANIKASFLKLVADPQDGEWAVLHRPFLTQEANAEGVPKDFFNPGRLGVVLTGHQHLLSLNTFRDSRPPELIVGNGGTALDQSKPENSSALLEFGFLTMEKQAEGIWLVTARNSQGVPRLNCTLTQQSGKKTEMTCTKNSLL